MIFEMAVSFEGVLGILLGEGEGSVKTTWVRNEVKSSYQNLAKNAKPISFTFHSKDSDQSIEKKSQLISDMAIATGKVRDPQLLKTNLMFKFNQFIEMGKLLNVNELKESGWKLTEFREVLSISAEGDVAPAIALGGLLDFEMRG